MTDTEKKGINALGVLLPTEYSFSDDKKLQVVTIDGLPWFLAAMVCKDLGLPEPKNSCRNLDGDEKLRRSINASGQRREMLLISESGLYSLIFRSKMPHAKAFRKWVTSEVLPEIRRSGSFTSPQPPPNGGGDAALQADAVVLHPDADIAALAAKAVEIAGSYRRLGQRMGCTEATVHHAVHGNFHLLSEDMKARFRRVCIGLMAHGDMPDVEALELLLQVDDKDVRMGLYKRLRKGGQI